MRATKKTTKKTVKFDYIVDITNAETAYDIFFKFALAKIKNQIPIEFAELNAIVAITADVTMSTVNALIKSRVHVATEQLKEVLNAINEKKEEEKPTKNIFKRFWNWLTNKK